jgi:type IV pilus assembly protein PilW
MRRIWRAEEGVTLIELMAAVVVTAIVAAAAMTILVTSNKATQVNEQVADVQQNVRLAMDLISQDIKLAGFNMTSAVGACTVGPVNLPAPIVPGDNAPAGADAGPDTVRLVVPSMVAGAGGGTPVLSALATGVSNVISLSSADISAMVTSGLVVGSVVSLGGSFSSPLAAIGANSLTLTKFPPPSAQFPVGTPVYFMQCVPYAISTVPAVCGGSTSCLLRNGVPMVDGIEDLQLAYACDGCNVLAPNTPLPNGVIDDQDAPIGTPIGAGVFNAADFVTNNAWSLPPMVPDKIKLVQVTIVARENQPPRSLAEGNNRQPINTAGPVIVSDHNPSADAGYNATTYSQQRRRVLTRTIQVRNMEL